MDGIIEVKVNGHTISKDNDCAGVQGEANSTKLRISFAENWYEFGKKITFWDALGQNPVDIQLGTNRNEGILAGEEVYLVPIPPEAMTEAGYNVFVIEGVIDGAVKRTVEDKLKVKPCRKADNAGEPTSPTPDEAAQLRLEIDAIKGDIAAAKASAVQAKESEENAEKAKQSIEDMTVTIEEIERGASPTVEKTTVDEVVNLHFGMPKVDPGVCVSEEEPTDEDVIVWINPDGESNEFEIVEEYVNSVLGAHTNNFDNPHNVTARQLGATTEADVMLLIPQSEDVKRLNTIVASLHSDVMGMDGVVGGVRNELYGIQKQINEEAHFRGYLTTNAKIQALEATPNDFAYSAESGTKWVYDAESGWQDTGAPVPDQLTPASDATPLADGVATPGTANEYARGDHRHPTDTTRVSVEEFNTLKYDIERGLGAILAIQDSYIGGEAE